MRTSFLQSSSAYSQPEMLEFINNDDSNSVFVRTYETDVLGVPIQNGLLYTLLVARPSSDMIVTVNSIYMISCTLENHILFFANNEGNLDHWTDDYENLE